MASSAATNPTASQGSISKLSRLPKSKTYSAKYIASEMLIQPIGARVHKRPILHPPIPSPYANASQQKVVYVSTKTPFISAVKRVRKLLTEIDKRSMGKVDLVNGKGSDKQKLQKLSERTIPSTRKEAEAVVLKATNRAIERALGLALFFQGQDDCRVRLTTGSVGVIDDIVEDCGPRGETEVDGEVDEEAVELPESRIRKASVLEVAITLK